MPELPEVEYGRRVAEWAALGRRIERVISQRDPIVFDGVSSARFSRVLTGRQVNAVRRRGKYLWFELDERPWPLFHFGMTGSFQVPDKQPLRLASDGQRELPDVWPPPYRKLHLFFDDGGELVMVNKRRLGRIRLRDDPETEPPISELGFDPLLDLPSPGKFAELCAARGASLKGLLLDQAFAAGVGNWIADEVLYQARLDPRRAANSLDPDELKRLRQKLRSVIETAVKVDADKERLPRTWLFHHRWGKNPKAVTSRGERIEHLRVAGRTTAWVPEVQN